MDARPAPTPDSPPSKCTCGTASVGGLKHDPRCDLNLPIQLPASNTTAEGFAEQEAVAEIRRRLDQVGFGVPPPMELGNCNWIPLKADDLRRVLSIVTRCLDDVDHELKPVWHGSRVDTIRWLVEHARVELPPECGIVRKAHAWRLDLATGMQVCGVCNKVSWPCPANVGGTRRHAWRGTEDDGFRCDRCGTKASPDQIRKYDPRTIQS